MPRVCVVGCGPIGDLHASIHAELPQSDLVAVCDWVRERAEATARRLGVKAYTSNTEMLATERPKILDVCTGGEEFGSEHMEPAVQGFEAGCHVLCEKPISNSIDDAARMVAAAREHGRCFGINFNHRFTPAARLARQWLDEGLLGHRLFMNVEMWIMNPRESSPWFMVKALNPHMIDIMRYFFGEIARVHCFAVKAPGRTIWSTAQFNMQFADGSLGHLTGSYDIERGHPMERVEMAGGGGRILIEDIWREATYMPAGNPEKRVYTNPLFGGYHDFDDTFRERIRTFVNQIGDGARPDQIDGSGADGLAAQRVLAAAIEAIESGKVIEVQRATAEV